MVKAYFSNRIYKSDLNKETLKFIEDLLLSYNRVYHYCYNFLVIKNRNNLTYQKSDYFIIKEKFPDINVYIRNSAFQEAKGLYDSNMELLKLQIANTEEQIKRVQNKLDKEIKKKETYQKLKDSLKSGTPFNLPHITFSPSGEVVIRCSKKLKNTKYFKDIYAFETTWLKEKQKQLKGRVGQLTFRLNKLQKHLEILTSENYIPSSTFGGKKLKQQFFIKTGMTKNERRKCRRKQQEFKFKRRNSLIIDGKGEIPSGNYMFKYNPETFTLTIIDNKKEFVINNVQFPYGQNEINFFYKRQNQLKGKIKGVPITFSLEDKGDWFVVKCMLDSYKVHQLYNTDEEKQNFKNYSRNSGIIAVDINVGFVSVCDLNERGMPLSFKDIHYSYKGKNTNQVKYNIEQAVKQLVDMAAETNKPIVIEQLKVKGTLKLKDYGDDKCKNKNRSSFAYKKFTETIASRCERFGVELYKINPAYTSYIAKIKYQPIYKRSVHQLAALSIGRRCLNCKERIPKKLVSKYKIKTNKSYINQWSDLYKTQKKLKLKLKIKK